MARARPWTALWAGIAVLATCLACGEAGEAGLGAGKAGGRTCPKSNCSPWLASHAPCRRRPAGLHLMLRRGRLRRQVRSAPSPPPMRAALQLHPPRPRRLRLPNLLSSSRPELERACSARGAQDCAVSTGCSWIASADGTSGRCTHPDVCSGLDRTTCAAATWPKGSDTQARGAAWPYEALGQDLHRVSYVPALPRAHCQQLCAPSFPFPTAPCTFLPLPACTAALQPDHHHRVQGGQRQHRRLPLVIAKPLSQPHRVSCSHLHHQHHRNCVSFAKTHQQHPCQHLVPLPVSIPILPSLNSLRR